MLSIFAASGTYSTCCTIRMRTESMEVVAMDLHTSHLHVMRASTVLLATGGYGRAFARSSNAHANTGDALGIILRNGLALRDMEFVQFHPTGLAETGILISEAARGEGAHLLNSEGDRFMAGYAPEQMELASRDIVSHACETEILAGRGTGPKGQAVYLDARHLGKELIMERLPELHILAQKLQGEDMITEPIRVAPTAHYSMGGIPTDTDGRVSNGRGVTVHGLYAAGECACVSVHGANRLGGNSLLEALVFGERAGRAMAADLSATPELRNIPRPDEESYAASIRRLDSFFSSENSHSFYSLRSNLQETMTSYSGIFRSEEGLEIARSALYSIAGKLHRTIVKDISPHYNTELLEALEFENMVLYSAAIVESALARRESRGAHFRSDFPHKDDEHWQFHTRFYFENSKPSIHYEQLRSEAKFSESGLSEGSSSEVQFEK